MFMHVLLQFVLLGYLEKYIVVELRETSNYLDWPRHTDIRFLLLDVANLITLHTIEIRNSNKKTSLYNDKNDNLRNGIASPGQLFKDVAGFLAWQSTVSESFEKRIASKRAENEETQLVMV